MLLRRPLVKLKRRAKQLQSPTPRLGSDLALDGEQLRRLPLPMRKTNLARLLPRRPDGVFVHRSSKARSGLSLRGLADASHGLPGADEAVAFIETTLQRAEGERVARLAVEKLALLAATSALNQGLAATCRAVH
jgi:hypothetical protein